MPRYIDFWNQFRFIASLFFFAHESQIKAFIKGEPSPHSNRIVVSVNRYLIYAVLHRAWVRNFEFVGAKIRCSDKFCGCYTRNFAVFVGANKQLSISVGAIAPMLTHPLLHMMLYNPHSWFL